MFNVYIIESLVDGSYYIGQTEDIENRIEQHNEGLSRYTSKKRPWKVRYVEQYKTRKEALQRECFLKRQRNRSFYQHLIDNDPWSGSSVG